MEWVTLATDLGLTPLNIVLCLMLYFIGSQSGIFPKFWKSQNPVEPQTREELQALLLQQMKTLTGHFNHETTGLLTKISDTLDLIIRKQEEWDKFGIPIRDCNEKHK